MRWLTDESINTNNQYTRPDINPPSDWTGKHESIRKLHQECEDIKAWMRKLTICKAYSKRHGGIKHIREDDICGISLPYHLGPNESLYCGILNWMTERVARICKGEHPSVKLNKYNSLISATWELIRLSLGDEVYWNICRCNIIPFSTEVTQPMCSQRKHSIKS